MARKKKKQRKQIKHQIRFEVIGLLLVFLALFGSGMSLISDGLIPRSLEYLFRFFFGMWYFVVSLFLLITGIYLMVKRTTPNFLHKKLIGFYLFFIGLIVVTHIQTFERLLVLHDLNKISILQLTWSHFWSYVTGVGVSSQLGGGMVAGILFTIFSYLFSIVGTKVISIFFIVVGLTMITNISLNDLLSQFYHRLKQNISTFFQSMIEKKNKGKQERDHHPVIEHEKERPELGNVESTETYSASEVQVPSNEFEEKELEISMSEKHQKDEAARLLEAEAISDSLVNNNDGTVDYELPRFDLLNKPEVNKQKKDRSHIQETAHKLEETFQSFGVKATITKVHVGPAVTKYEVYPDAGVKVSRIVSLHDDIALALAAKDIRIEAPIPGKSAVGIEVPNEEIAMVSLVEVLRAKQSDPNKLLFALGRDISGKAVAGNLANMPHLLIAGATGSGKSVCLNGIITTILMRAKPDEVKMMMIDPKKVELNVYNGVPHLLAPVVTDPRKAAQALMKVVSEMERRYDLFSESGTRNLEGYNKFVQEKNEAEDANNPTLPYIVVIVDELADLMMVASSEVEDAIARLAQMARAAGIHLIIATQRPSVDVITGVIKANIPSRIAFSVSSQTDSRTILDTGGAEKLLGKGDMLYIPVGDSKPTRVQGAFLSDEEVERVVQHCIDQQIAIYEERMIPDDEPVDQTEVDDELYDDAVQLIIEANSASVSMLQRRLRIGYNRAARLIDAMEERGIIGPHEGSKPRTVLISEIEEDTTNPQID